MTLDTIGAAGRARAEIAAMDRELQVAFDRILDAAERVALLAATPGPEVAADIAAALTEIFEASGVRDIAGQRLSAVSAAIDDVASAGDTEAGLERKRDNAANIEEKYQDGSALDSGLLNGPQLPGAGRTQTEVDALFDKLD